jgi:hydrogenase maturation protease
MSAPRLLVAGLGNVFLGDDAFGVEVVGRLAGRPLPEGVDVVDFGIRGLDLAYALLDGYDAAILVDATRRGGPPGTLYLLEPDPAAGGSTADAHGMDPAAVLRWVREVRGSLPWLRLVGCEPATLDSEDGRMELSEPVRAAVGEAVRLIESLVAGWPGKP